MVKTAEIGRVTPVGEGEHVQQRTYIWGIRHSFARALLLQQDLFTPLKHPRHERGLQSS